MKSGFVSIVGRPNVGKSTLLNKLLNKKIAITSDKVGTTRNMIYGVYNEDDTQIVFVDTPGINKATSKLGEVLNKTAYSSFENDLVLFVVDIASGFGANDQKILEKLNSNKQYSYQLVIEGNAAIPWQQLHNGNFNPDNATMYDLSYRRALALYNRWRSKGLNFRQYNTEIIIAGSGFNGNNRDTKIEDYNKRFVIQIIPKIDRPEIEQ